MRQESSLAFTPYVVPGDNYQRRHLSHRHWLRQRRSHQAQIPINNEEIPLENRLKVGIQIRANIVLPTNTFLCNCSMACARSSDRTRQLYDCWANRCQRQVGHHPTFWHILMYIAGEAGFRVRTLIRLDPKKQYSTTTCNNLLVRTRDRERSQPKKLESEIAPNITCQVGDAEIKSIEAYWAKVTLSLIIRCLALGDVVSFFWSSWHGSHERRWGLFPGSKNTRWLTKTILNPWNMDE